MLHYRFCQFPFGFKPSPAILNTVLQKHFAQYKTSEPDAFKLLSRSIFVDDFIGGVKNN